MLVNFLYFKSDSVDGCVFLNRALYVSEMVPYTEPRHGSRADDIGWEV